MYFTLILNIPFARQLEIDLYYTVSLHIIKTVLINGGGFDVATRLWARRSAV